MRRTPLTALACAIAACCALAPPALARNVQEIGSPHGLAFPKADCPTNEAQPTDPMGCQVLAQLTGFNVRLNGVHNPMRLKRSGYIVAFTVELAKPNADQLTFFKGKFGSTPSARLAIVQSQHHENGYKLVAQTQSFELEPYLGSTPTIALRKPFRVHKDDIVALTVPTWLPAFVHNVGNEEIWRSSRQGDECTAADPPPDPHDALDTVKAYDCVYRGAKMLYSATFVGDPRPTNTAKSR
jgi:hypothetical protein